MDETTTNSITLSYQEVKLTGQGDLAVIGVLVFLAFVVTTTVLMFRRKISRMLGQNRQSVRPPPRE